MIIIITNIITIGLLISTIVVLILKTGIQNKLSFSQYQLFFAFFLLVIGTIFDTLFHLNCGKLFDVYGEYIYLLFFPIVILSIFSYSLNRELEKRKKSELQLQIQNEEYSKLNSKLLEGNEHVRKTNEALSKTNMELDSFVYRVSHDLRSPICTAMGLVNLSFESTDINEIKEYLLMQDTSLKRLDQFIKDILDYSKNVHMEMIPQLINFDQLIDSAFVDYRTTHSENIQLIKKIEGSVPFVNNLLRMKIIFNNLISNAIKFQNEGVLNKLIEIRVYTTSEQAVISIRDNGIGIQDKFKKDIFKIFFRATTHNTGSGIGLYIVKDCVQKLNGSLVLDSNYKEGTTIVVTIPNMPISACEDV